MCAPETQPQGTSQISLNLDKEIINEAKSFAKINHRSTSSQFEHWAKLGKIAEENPDLPMNFIKGVLLGLEQMTNKEVVPYKFG